jgi:hypothetical protein
VERVVREISNVGEDIQNGADAEPKWSSNLECAHGIFDVIHNIIDNGPSGIRVNNFEHCGSILVIRREIRRASKSTDRAYIIAAMGTTSK